MFPDLIPVLPAVHDSAYRHVEFVPVQSAHQAGKDFFSSSSGEGFHQKQDFQTGMRHKTDFQMNYFSAHGEEVSRLLYTAYPREERP